MSGIMVAVAGNAKNIVYGAGLYNTTTGVDLSPITASAVNITITRTWLGYFYATANETVPLSITTTAFEGGVTGDAFTQGRLWFGDLAITGFTDSNADIVATNNQTVTVNFSVTAGRYYPIRIRWDGVYEEASFGDDSGGSITLLANGSSNLSGKIFYNTLTNGF